MHTLIDDAGHWHGRAEETRTIAELIHDPEARRIMCDIAKGYDLLAERAPPSGWRIASALRSNDLAAPKPRRRQVRTASRSGYAALVNKV